MFLLSLEYSDISCRQYFGNVVFLNTLIRHRFSNKTVEQLYSKCSWQVFRQNHEIIIIKNFSFRNRICLAGLILVGFPNLLYPKRPWGGRKQVVQTRDTNSNWPIRCCWGCVWRDPCLSVYVCITGTHLTRNIHTYVLYIHMYVCRYRIFEYPSLHLLYYIATISKCD